MYDRKLCFLKLLSNLYSFLNASILGIQSFKFLLKNTLEDSIMCSVHVLWLGIFNGMHFNRTCFLYSLCVLCVCVWCWMAPNYSDLTATLVLWLSMNKLIGRKVAFF